MVTDMNLHPVNTDAGAEVSLRADQLYMEAKRYRAQYPEGTRIVLQHMNDPHHPVPPGQRERSVLLMTAATSMSTGITEEPSVLSRRWIGSGC